MKTYLISWILFLAVVGAPLNSFACEEFKPKGKLIRTMTSQYFTDLEGKLENLAVVFRSYDEDGDNMADVETGTRIFKDKGEEAFPFLYLKGKDIPMDNGKTFVLTPESEYTDVEATGKCENIIKSH